LIYTYTLVRSVEMIKEFFSRLHDWASLPDSCEQSEKIQGGIDQDQFMCRIQADKRGSSETMEVRCVLFTARLKLRGPLSLGEMPVHHRFEILFRLLNVT